MTEDQLFHLQGTQKDIGSQGEDFVLRYERQRLADFPKRLSEIAIVGRQDVGLGYDIASFESPASTIRDRFIEVKTFTGTPHFFLSQSEWAAATRIRDHYYLYLVDYKQIATPGYAPTIIKDPARTLTANPNWSELIQQREFVLSAAPADTLPQDLDTATVLVGCFKSNPHKTWILHNRCYNVRHDIVKTEATRQAASAARPAASAPRPAASAAQPTASAAQPAVSPAQPTASAAQPTSSLAQPAASPAQPASSAAHLNDLGDLEVISRTPSIPGAVIADEIGLGVKYLLLYNVCEPRSYRLYSVAGASLASRAALQRMRYPNPRCPHYVLYKLSAALDTPALDIMSLLRTYNDKVARTSGTPIFMPGRALRGFLLDATEQRMKGSPAIKRVFTNEGKPWTANQSQRLEVLASMHQDIAAMAHALKRTPAEIHAQLRLLGLKS